MIFFIYLVAGAFAGLLAGLFGVGGGAIIVPILLVLFSFQSIDASVLVHLALGTSLATIVVTSVSSVIAHHRLGNVVWAIVKTMTPGLIVGVMMGALVAARVSGDVLQIIIGLFLCAVAAQIFFSIKPKQSFRLPGRAGQLTAGATIGAASAFFGIGGGSLTVPFLSACRLPMKQAVAVSAACGFPIALFGALAYLLSGIEQTQLPAAATGYVYWPAFLGIIMGSVPCSRIGAAFANRWPESLMKQLFSLLLLLVGLRLLVSAAY